MVFGRHCRRGRIMPIRSGTCYWESKVLAVATTVSSRGSDVRLETTHWTKHFLMVLGGTSQRPKHNVQ